MSEFPTKWKKASQCTDCGKVRPWFLFSRAPISTRSSGASTRAECDLCRRTRINRNTRRSRRNRRDEVRAAELRRYYETPIALRRCRNSFYQIRVRTPQNIPFWSTIESVLPIYEYAHELNLKEPEFRHTVCHIYRLRGKKVCGLHTLKNLRIVRAKIRHSPTVREDSA